jgi:hypothetical protein
MIKGIARRLNLEWGLCSKWSEYAKDCLLAANEPSQLLPIWSVAVPEVATTRPIESSTMRLAFGHKIIRFSDVVSTFISWLRLLQVLMRMS